MQEFLQALTYFLITAISLVPLPFILLISELFSQLVRLYLCLKHKQWINLMDNFGTLFVLHREQHETVSGIYMIFQGTLDLNNIKNKVKSKWIEVKHNGQYTYPHLRQHSAESCGYFYWLPDKDFSIDNHVQLCNCIPPTNQNELNDIYSQLSSQPLPKDQSKWLVLVFPLSEDFVGEPQYVIFSRFDHCLGDGYNIIRMLNNCFLDEQPVKYLASKPRKPFSLTTFLRNIFYFPKYSIVDQSLAKDWNILHGPKQTAKRIICPSPPYSISRMKKIQKSTGATINDIVISCISGALKRYFFQHKALPLNDVHGLIPVAMQSGSEEGSFDNMVSYFVMPLDLSDGTALERLKSTQQVVRRLKKTQFHYFNYLLVKLILNRLPAWITRGFYYLFDFTIVITNVPLQQNQCFNDLGQELMAYSGFPAHNIKLALALAITSFNGNIQLGVSADEAIMDKKDVNILIQAFTEEFEKLENNV